jgi:hypothetical protein
VKPRRPLVILGVAGVIAGSALLGTAVQAGSGGSWSWSGCGDNVRLCTEVADAKTAFGHYVGHDEPSVLFYSDRPGSGNHVEWNLTLPTEPKGAFSDTKAYSAEVTPAYWFGMAMCDSQSYPEQTTTCTPDSDSNIINPNEPGSYRHAAGAAYMELQFYPPGFAPQFAGFSCDATRWCVALTIDSLSEDPIDGTTLNPTCTSEIGGSIEYVNFAYLTLNGVPLGPPNPLDFEFLNSGDPQPVPGRANNDTLFMNQGDSVTVKLADTVHGLLAEVHDNTTGQTGKMVASAANGFGQIQYAPTGTTCNEIPYDFHPMYSTSSPATRVLWAAHGYNIAMDAETGHFDFCSHLNADTGLCDGLEGVPGDQEPADGDDYGCFADVENSNPDYTPPRGQSAAYCVATNDPGFDGTSYKNYWPNGSSNHETSILFSSPLTGSDYDTSYPQADFQTDLPRIEASDLGGHCNRLTGEGCTDPPISDDGTPVTFYPYFSTVSAGGDSCVWGIGSTLPNTISNYGKDKQYGSLYYLYYWAFGGHGATVHQTDNYDSGPFDNPC